VTLAALGFASGAVTRRAAFGLPLFFGCLLACAAAFAQDAQPRDVVPRLVEPEASTARVEREAVAARRFMVVAAHPAASRAGADVLRRGGNAIDAAVAVQLVLGLVEPQSSGIGGGAFLLHFDAASGRVRAYDGRETAPAAAGGDLFLDAAGKPLGFFAAVTSGRAVGVPGTLAALEAAHRAHGRLAWHEVVAPAIVIAREGFELSPRLHALLAWDRFLQRDPAAAAYFYRPDGTPKPVGTRLVNEPYAQTLESVSRDGAAAFLNGPIARDIVAAVRTNALPGAMTTDDLAAYRALEREPVCAPFRHWRVCGMPPPSSGGIAVLQMLALMERLPRTDFARAPVAAVHAFSEAGRLAYADRDRFVADPAFAAVPMAGLLDGDYLAERARLVAPDRSLGRASPGVPPGAKQAGVAIAYPETGTTHFSIVDEAGNAVAVTSSVEQQFGNRTMVRGFLLNNQLTDFALYPNAGGAPVANRAAGGKRPRSSMAPTFVFDRDGRLVLIAGSPGGQMIINYVAKTLLAVLEWGLPPQAALDLPNFGSRNGPTEVEAGVAGDALAAGLAALGHEVRRGPLASGVHLIVRTPDGWLGAADPRREGVAVGE
jgi:gamma-glutamyltranspeptidase/glutathione hydrolase